MTNPPPPPYPPQPGGNYPPPPGSPQATPKKRKKWPWILGGIVVIIVIIAIASGGSSKKDDSGKVVSSGNSSDAAAPAAKPNTPHIGDSVQIKDGNAIMVITVANVRQGEASQFSTVTGTLYEADVTVKCTQGTCSDINPLYFSGATNNGTHLQMSLASVDNQLSSDTIPAGQQSVGSIGFDVPVGQQLTSVSFKPGMISGSTTTWTQ